MLNDAKIYRQISRAAKRGLRAARGVHGLHPIPNGPIDAAKASHKAGGESNFHLATDSGGSYVTGLTTPEMNGIPVVAPVADVHLLVSLASGLTIAVVVLLGRSHSHKGEQDNSENWGERKISRLPHSYSRPRKRIVTFHVDLLAMKKQD